MQTTFAAQRQSVQAVSRKPSGFVGATGETCDVNNQSAIAGPPRLLLPLSSTKAMIPIKFSLYRAKGATRSKQGELVDLSRAGSQASR